MQKNNLQHIDSGKYPMKYYNALTNFLLIASFILNFANSLMIFSELIKISAEITDTNGFYIFNWVYGFAVLAFSFFSLYVRNELKNYSKTVPTLMTLYFFIYYAIEILYKVISSYVIGTGAEGEVLALLFIGSMIILANHEYFKKRKDMFVYTTTKTPKSDV